MSDGAARSQAETRRFLAALLGLLVLGGALRAAALAWNPSIVPIGDERTYVETAVNIANGRGHVSGPHATRAGWPPAHPGWLSLFVDPERAEPGERYREGVRPLLAAQTALGTLLVLLTALLGRALFDARTGCLAGALAALDPTLVAYSHYLWAEPLLAVLVTTALLVVLAAASHPRRHGLAALAGLVFGAAVLARELAAPLAAACALWWIRVAAPAERRRAAARGLVLLAAAALVVLPWTLRNYRLFGRVVPVSGVGWMALREGNTLARPDWWRIDEAALTAFRLRYFAIADEMARMDLARREALTLIRVEQPEWLAKKLALNLPLLFGPDSYLFTKLRLGAYGAVPRARVRALVALGAGFHAFALLAALAGVAGSPERGRRALALLLFGAFALLHVVANAKSRYRVPLEPLLLAYASHALRHAGALRRELRGPALAGALAAALFFALVCVPRFASEVAPLWREGVR
jgi:hypothetical protein